MTQTFNIHSASCSSRQLRQNKRELRVVSQWEEGQQGESDHKRLLKCNQHGEDAPAGDWQGQLHGDRGVVDNAHQLFT